MKSYKKFMSEDAPTNNAGVGQVDGIGVGPRGEPGVRRSVMMMINRRNKLRKRKKDA